MKKIGKFLATILALALFAGLVLVTFAIVKDFFTSDSVETIHSGNVAVYVEEGKESSNKSEMKNPIESVVDIFTSSNDKEEQKYSTTNSVGKFYYEQLNDTSKIIYNGLQENKDKLKQGNYSIEFGNKFYDILSQENGDKVLGDDYQSAIEAFTHDNVDLFYIDVQKLYLNIETKKKLFKTTYNVYIKPMTGKTYYAEGFTSSEQISQILNKIEQYKNQLKAKKTYNDYDNIKLIHDYIIENTEYDEALQEKNRYNIYGALIEKKCVCEGYARAFKYLIDAMGIENILMQGTATNSQGQTENHAWNAVKLYGKWYLIDTTWDDPIIIGSGYIPSNTHYRYFLKGTDNFYKDHKLDPRFTQNGKVFQFPAISRYDYN